MIANLYLRNRLIPGFTSVDYLHISAERHANQDEPVPDRPQVFALKSEKPDLQSPRGKEGLVILLWRLAYAI